ncbi:MAG: tetratricopeptide repeat protein [Myxococcota bacterium]
MRIARDPERPARAAVRRSLRSIVLAIPSTSLLASLLAIPLTSSPVAAESPAATATTTATAQRRERDRAQETPLERLERLLREHPDEAPLSWAYAQALAEAGRTDDAIGELERHARVWPDHGVEIPLTLGRWYYERDRLEPAREALLRALARDDASGEGHLYLGLVLTRAGHHRQAIAQFDLAARFAPALAADAALLTGLAWIDEGDASQGASILRELVRRHPDSQPARFARLVLGERADSGDPIDLSAYTGVEYDSNVPLDSGTGFGGISSNKSDFRGAWGAYGSVRVFGNADFEARIGARYDGIAHFDLDRFDTHRVHGYGSALWRATSRLRLRLDGSVQYATLDDDPYLLSGLIRPSLLYDWGARTGISRLMLEVEPLEFEQDALFRSLERDGVSFGGGAEHYWSIPGWSSSWLSLGAHYRRLQTDGGTDTLGTIAFQSAYDSHRWRGVVAAHGRLPGDVLVEVSGAVSGEIYDNDNFLLFLSTIERKKRDDLVYEAGASLSRPIVRGFDVELSWRFIQRDSNIGEFSYDRHVVALHFVARPLEWWN